MIASTIDTASADIRDCMRGARQGVGKPTPLPRGPSPAALFVTLHHGPAPGLSVTPGVSEHNPVPLAQPACAAVYHCRMRPPELSSSHSRYCVALATAFHVNVGVDVAMLPAGASRVAAPGGGVPASVKGPRALHGPLPAALLVTIHHGPAPGDSSTLTVRDPVPVPLAQPASAAVYHCRRRPPELSSSHSRYCVAPATAFQVYVGVVVAMLPDGASSVAGPGGGVPATVKPIPALHGPLPEALAVTIHHCPAPGVSSTLGVSEHVPVPPAQPASVAVYQCRMRPPELSSIQSRYSVAVGTAVQV